MNLSLFSRRWIPVFLVSIFFRASGVVGPAPASAQVHFSTEERRIITITDERRDADSLLGYLTSGSTRVACRAAIGIGNIGDTSVRPALLNSFLAERRDSVADAEAFALGLLGPDEKTCQALTAAAAQHPTAERLKAIARTAEKTDSASVAKIVGQLADQKKIDPRTEADAYVEFALHHEVSSRMMNDLDLLAGDNEPNVRWRAAYAFARADDSTDLASRFSKLNDLLLDQGSPYVRMFAALALGKLHNARAGAALAHAYRGEDEWRVRVNILRAFGQFPKLDSLPLETIQLAADSALRDSALAIQIGLTAGDMIDHFVTSGTLVQNDSTQLRAWLDGFNGAGERHNEVAPVVAARLTVPAVRLQTPTKHDAIQNYARYQDPVIRNWAVRAAATQADTDDFATILKTMAAFSPVEQVVRLEALDSIWQKAKHLPAFRSILEKNHMADLYRGLLVHISDAVQDPAVDASALGELMDTSIIRDSAHRAEAMEYMEKYIPRFSSGRYRDALLAAIGDVAWLGDTSRAADEALRIAYDTANNWGDNIVMDSIASLLKHIEGPRIVGDAYAPLPKRTARISAIDWKGLENLPANMSINFSGGQIQLRLLTEEAPLTVLNMVRLAREQWFTGNTVHRVVPNFVIQSGDPSGTGWSGPGYTIRSEIAPREYDREGMMGMARDGKDTESSQWFITECPTPHLDGLYTIWADVTDGMDQVFQQNVGNRVGSVFLSQ